ncbi:HipA N-terminal domain-containing protein [Rhodoflexus sp.]
MRTAQVKIYDRTAGRLIEDEDGYHFQYDADYLQLSDAVSISLTLPLQSEAFHSKVLFPFFDGLIPEGWLLHIVEKNWKLNPRDRMGLLLACCRDCIGAVSIENDSIEIA